MVVSPNGPKGHTASKSVGLGEGVAQGCVDVDGIWGEVHYAPPPPVAGERVPGRWLGVPVSGPPCHPLSGAPPPGYVPRLPPSSLWEENAMPPPGTTVIPTIPHRRPPPRGALCLAEPVPRAVLVASPPRRGLSEDRGYPPRGGGAAISEPHQALFSSPGTSPPPRPCASMRYRMLNEGVNQPWLVQPAVFFGSRKLAPP